jgi:hypothetical protein
MAYLSLGFSWFHGGKAELGSKTKNHFTCRSEYLLLAPIGGDKCSEQWTR